MSATQHSACPDNCLCTSQSVKCFLDDCEDDNISSGYAPVLEIVGEMCERQVAQLESVAHHYSTITVVGGTCPAVPNCR